MATNTIHKVFDDVKAKTKIQMLSIIDATIDEIVKDNAKCVGLLGTKYTMKSDFYKRKLNEKGIKVIIPEEYEIDIIDSIIDDDLVKGIILQESRDKYLQIIKKMVNAGADGIILGCTEIPLLIKQEHVSKKVYDTAIIHAEKALNSIIDEKS
jgi:aspartate racemase